MSLGIFKKGTLKRVPPEKDEASIGNLAMELGYITPTVLVEALRVQKKRILLGEILVKMEAITREQLEELLFEQRLRRDQASKIEIITHERKKMRRQFQELGSVFKDATCHANKFVATVKLADILPSKSGGAKP